MRPGRVPIRALTLAALVLVAVVEVFPYVWMVSTSLKDMAGVTRFPPTLWPSEPQWQNYAKAWASGPFLRYAVNNAIQTLGILVCQLFFGCLAGFAFSKLRWNGRDACFLIVIACLIVPPQVRFVPLYMLFSVVYHWNDFFWPLVMTTSEAVRTLPIGVAMLREEGTGDRWHVIMAGSMFVVAPVLAVFIVAQRHIIRAFTFTSLK